MTHFYVNTFKILHFGKSLAVQQLGLGAVTAMALGLILGGQKAKILYAKRHGQKKKNTVFLTVF